VNRPVAHRFVEFVPAELDQATLYISMTYGTVVHLCLCGCRERVTTPLMPTDWRLTFDGETVSLDPSVGNWSFDCQSHYWIKRSRVFWAGQWSRQAIEASRERDRRAKRRHFTGAEPGHPIRRAEDEPGDADRAGWLSRLRRRIGL
jgi:hypothetical protein